MSNRQVIAIFIIGVALLLGAFWAGLYVVRQDTATNTNQTRAANQNSQNQNSQTGKASSSSLTTQPPQAPNETRYIVQVGGSFGTAEKANELTARLRPKYLSAYTQNPTGSDTLYRVLIGPYGSREDAQQIANELASQGFKGVMIFPLKGN